MILTGSFDFNGIPVSGAFGRVAAIRILNASEMLFDLAIYATDALLAADRPFTSVTMNCVYDDAAGDIYGQAAAHVLGQPEFAGWSVVAQ